MAAKQASSAQVATTMSAVAGVAIQAPTESADARVLGFFITPNNVLALTTVPAECASDSSATYSTTDSSVIGYIQNPSSLAAVPLGGLTAVYGVIKKSTCTPGTTAGEVSLLSPVTMPLGIQCDTMYGRIATSSDLRHDIARLYYRQAKSATDSAPEKKIREVTLAGPSMPFNPQTVLDDSDIVDSTYLAAYYDSTDQERHVMFQNNNGKICDLNIEDGTRDVLGNANPEITPTGLAAIYIPDNDKAYCYYVYKEDFNGSTSRPVEYQLYKDIREWDDKHEKWVWKGGRKVTPTTLVAKTTQLSVTSKLDTRENYIVYTNTSNIIACKHDSW